MTQSTVTLTIIVQNGIHETINGCSEESVCFQWAVNRNQEIIAVHNLDWTCTQYSGLLRPENFTTVQSIIDHYDVLNEIFNMSITKYICSKNNQIIK